MPGVLKADERVSSVSFTADLLSVALMDGRTISVPLTWYPRFLHATHEQLTNWKVAGGAMEFTGRIWMKIWALKAFCAEHRPRAILPKHNRSALPARTL